jgi:hypothetical protein
VKRRGACHGVCCRCVSRCMLQSKTHSSGLAQTMHERPQQAPRPWHTPTVHKTNARALRRSAAAECCRKTNAAMVLRVRYARRDGGIRQRRARVCAARWSCFVQTGDGRTRLQRLREAYAGEAGAQAVAEQDYCERGQSDDRIREEVEPYSDPTLDLPRPCPLAPVKAVEGEPIGYGNGREGAREERGRPSPPRRGRRLGSTSQAYRSSLRGSGRTVCARGWSTRPRPTTLQS